MVILYGNYYHYMVNDSIWLYNPSILLNNPYMIVIW